MDASIIVPIYNVEEYLPESLESLDDQTGVAYEVILVDDGSTDSSGQIAKDFAKTHSNFSYYHKENGGQAQARNFGVRFAKGDYISFVDPDDIIEPDYLELMVNAARRDGSEIAICNVARLDSTGCSPSTLHTHVFRNLPPVTNIRESHQLLYDTSSCNKVILRSFYLRSGITFPEGIVFEDIPFNAFLHCLASSISVVYKTCYYWRIREGSNLSTTQQNASTKNLRDRFTALSLVSSFLSAHSMPESLTRSWNVKQFRIDLIVFANILPSMEDNAAREYLDLINGYINENLDEALLDELTVIQREKIRCIRSCDLDRLSRLCDYQANVAAIPLREESGHLYGSLPENLFTTTKNDFTGELRYRSEHCILAQNKTSHGTLELYGAVYHRRIDMPLGNQSYKACMRHQKTGVEVPLTIEPYEIEWLQEAIGTIRDPATGEQVTYDSSGNGFKISLAEDTLSHIEITDGAWNVFVTYENRITTGTVLLANPRRKAKQQGRNASLIGSRQIEIVYTRSNEVELVMSPVAAIVTSIEKRKGSLVFQLDRDVDGLALIGSDNANLSSRETDASIDQQGAIRLKQLGNRCYSLPLSKGIVTSPTNMLVLDKNHVAIGRVAYDKRTIKAFSTGTSALLVCSLKSWLLRFEEVEPCVAAISTMRNDGSKVAFNINIVGKSQPWCVPKRASIVMRQDSGSDIPIAKGILIGNRHIGFRISESVSETLGMATGCKGQLIVQLLSPLGDNAKDLLVVSTGKPSTQAQVGNLTLTLYRKGAQGAAMLKVAPTSS